MKVNDYVRTTNGYIGKIFNINEYREPTLKYGILTNYIDMIDTHFIGEEDIAKSSPNIIDLIENGDYVNGYIVNEITDIDTGLPILCNFDLNTMRWTPLEEIDIWYSILTKELFESMEYRIGE